MIPNFSIPTLPQTDGGAQALEKQICPPPTIPDGKLNVSFPEQPDSGLAGALYRRRLLRSAQEVKIPSPAVEKPH